jgi:hypothetical protein
LRKYKLSGNDQSLAELIQAGGETLLSGIHIHIHSIWNKEKLPDESITVPAQKKGDKSECINYLT